MKKLIKIFLLFIISIPSFSQGSTMTLSELQNYEVRMMPFDVRLRTAPYTVQTISKNKALTTEMLRQYLLSALKPKIDTLNLRIDSTKANILLKANVNSPTFTGTVSGITKSMVGLSNVDNTSDLNKPISTINQAALNLKANSANSIFTGTFDYGDNTLNNQFLRINNYNGTTNTTMGGIKFYNQISTGFEIARIEYGQGSNYVSDGFLNFKIGNAGAFNSVMYLKENGNVGIGTNSPNHLLSVAGTTNTNQLIINSSVNNGNTFQVTGNSTMGNLTLGATSFLNGHTLNKLNVVGDVWFGDYNTPSVLSIEGRMQFKIFDTNVAGIKENHATSDTGGITLQKANSGVLTDGFSLFYNGDVQVETIGAGIILKSPNGTRYRITVGNTGTLTTTGL